MGLGLGKSSSSSKGTADTQMNSTTTPNNPDWVTNGVKDVSSGILGLAGQDPSKFVAGPSALQNSQFGVANAMGQAGAGFFDQAGDLANRAANSGAFGYNPAMATSAQVGPMAHSQGLTGAEQMGAYANPYQSQVIGSTMDQLKRGFDLAQNSNGQGAVLSGQYGGSRHGVLDANAMRDYLDKVGSTIGGLNYQGFTTAAGLGQSDADRLTQNNQFNAGSDNARTLAQAGYDQQTGLANQGANNQAWQFNAGQNDVAAQRQLAASGILGDLAGAGYGALSGAGATQQGIDQAQAQAPVSVLSQLAGVYGNLPFNLFQGQTTNGTSSQQTTGKNTGFSAGLSLGGK